MNAGNGSGEPLEPSGEATKYGPGQEGEKETPSPEPASKTVVGEEGRSAGREEKPPAPAEERPGWFRRHKVLAGILAGLIIAALLGGMFAIGYVVGKPDEKEGERGLPPRWGVREDGWPTPRERLREMRDELRDEIGRWWGILAESRKELVEFIAGQLGISVDQLRDELRGGKSVADLAEEKGRSPEELVDSLAAKIEELADKLAAEDEIPPYLAEAVKDHSEALASFWVHRGFRLLGPPARK